MERWLGLRLAAAAQPLGQSEAKHDGDDSPDHPCGYRLQVPAQSVAAMRAVPGLLVVDPMVAVAAADVAARTR
jgi:hypothetical protein